jgi:vancomycin resistance protein YoaR
VDPALLDGVLETTAVVLDDPPVNAGLSIKGDEITVIEGQDGRVVDRDAARAGVKELLFSLSSGTVPIRMKTQAPTIQAADTSGAVDQAKTMLDGSVGLEFEDLVWALSPAETAKAMDFTTEGEGPTSRLVPYLSAEKLASLFEEVAKAVKRDPKNATWETDGETATLIPGKPGTTLDPTGTAEALTEAALSRSSRVAKVVVVEAPPARTTEQAEAMGIKSKLASYTTEFGGSDGRRENVARAAELISGTLLGPGEEFDFDTVVGQRTPANGFQTAPAIVAGKLEETLGGGICQVSTTLFNAVFFAGLDVTARTNHSIYISHYPKGRDATVSWGGPAFRFRNDTDHWVLIKAAASWSSLTFVIYGTPVNRQVTYTTGDWYNIQPPAEKRVKTDELFEGEERETDSGQTGKQIKVTRKVIQDGKTIHSDVFVSSYPMRPRIIEEGSKPTTTTTAPPSTTSTTTTPATSTTSTTGATSTTTP